MTRIPRRTSRSAPLPVAAEGCSRIATRPGRRIPPVPSGAAAGLARVSLPQEAGA